MQMICITLLSLFLTSEPEAAEFRPDEAYLSLSTPDLAKQIAIDSQDLKILVLDNPKQGEEEAQSLYEAYYRMQRFKAYPGLYIESNKKLPGDFAERAWSDRAIILIELNTPRDVLWHLFLHHTLPHATKRQQILQNLAELTPDQRKSVEGVSLRTQLFLVDLELRTDLTLLENSEVYAWNEAELTRILNRLERQIQRFTHDWLFFEPIARQHSIDTTAVNTFLEESKQMLSGPTN
jgi:hypothetical protein